MTALAASTTLILVRHGETEWNRQGRIQGHTDSALTDEGIAQAKACAQRLRDEQIDQMVASDLGRAQQTAAILNVHLNREIRLNSGLRERCFGMAEGRSYAELDADFPELFSRIRDVDPHYAMDGAESRAVFHTRVVNAIQKIAKDHASQRVLVVTHGGVLGVIYRWLNNLTMASPQKIDIPNVGYNRIALVNEKWRVEVWGDISHLL